MSDVMRDTQLRAAPCRLSAPRSTSRRWARNRSRCSLPRSARSTSRSPRSGLSAPEPVPAADRRRSSGSSRRGPRSSGRSRLGKDGAAVHLLQVPDDGRRQRPGDPPAATSSSLITQAVRGAQGRHRLVQDRERPAGHPARSDCCRRTSIDELPQLLNVLTGEMSLVGPRPPLRYEVELYSARALRRLECRPGITGLWQVSGRCETTFDEMVELDIEYIDTWSLGLDLTILRTDAAGGPRRKGGVVMSNDNLVVALVGYGYWGPNLLRNYMELSGVHGQVGLRPRRGQAGEGQDALPDGAGDRGLLRRAATIRRSTPCSSPRRSPPTSRSRMAAIEGRQARVRREADDRERR